MFEERVIETAGEEEIRGQKVLRMGIPKARYGPKLVQGIVVVDVDART